MKLAEPNGRARFVVQSLCKIPICYPLTSSRLLVGGCVTAEDMESERWGVGLTSERRLAWRPGLSACPPGRRAQHPGRV